MHRYRLVIISAFLLALSACGDHHPQQTQTESASSPRAFSPTPSTDGFTINLTKKSVLYEGEEAQRLAQEVAPVVAARTRRAMVNAVTSAPGNHYTGFNIDLALEPEGLGEASCKAASIFVSFAIENRDGRPRETRLALKNGTVAGHRFKTFGLNNRYLKLPEKPGSNQTLTEACSNPTNQNSKWMSDLEWSELANKEQALKDLVAALRAPTRTTISCIDFDLRPCSRTPAQLIAMLERIPPQHQRSLRVPGDAYITVFEYTEPVGMGAIGNDYSITSRVMPLGQTAIRVEFGRNSRPIT